MTPAQLAFKNKLVLHTHKSPVLPCVGCVGNKVQTVRVPVHSTQRIPLCTECITILYKFIIDPDPDAIIDVSSL